MFPFDLIHWYWIKKLFCWNPTTFHPIESWFQDCLTLLHHHVKLYHLYHYCKKKKIIIKKQSKSIDISLFCRSQLLGPLRQSSVKQSDSAENARKNAIEKNTCQKCGILTKYKLWVTSFISIGMVLVLKDRGPGFKSSRSIKCLY